MSENSNSTSCVYGDDNIMSQKEYGTSAMPIQENLRWSCDVKLAENVSNFNRHYAETKGYWRTTKFEEEVMEAKEMTFYDSNTGNPLFIVPRGRTMKEFLDESKAHGWPSFRDEEVVWENVRILEDGETVSLNGTHLGHNIPDKKGSRFCINLVSIAGNPTDDGQVKQQKK